MKVNAFACLLCGGAVMAVAAPASSNQVLFERGISLNGDDGWWSDSSQQIADSFTLGVDGTIVRASWYGNFFREGDPFDTGDTWDFTIRMFADDGGMPAVDPIYETPVTASITDDGMQQGVDRIYHFDADLTPVALEADTQYYLSILSSTTESFRWNNGTPNDGLSVLRYGDDEEWIGGTQRRLSSAFMLEAVPGPGSMALLALAGMAGRRRRR